MQSSFEQRLSQIAAAGRTLLQGGKKGIEKESLRVTQEGVIAATPHPPALGSALTNPHITTDYSEALLEFVTSPFVNASDTLKALREIHQFTYEVIQPEEMLWCTSMPCKVTGEEDVPLARYGKSNVGQMKHIYRRGLGYRYGRIMQAIAGVHFNYSLPMNFWPVFQDITENRDELQDFISMQYFALVRNFHRFGWIVPYLFGSSPAICKSFLGGRSAGFLELEPRTFYAPFATSLRMSDIGYNNQSQAALEISYNELESYVRDLTRAIETPHPPYERMGVKVGGEYRQLSTSILQIANEYYSFVRPKQIARSGEEPTLALQRRGVEYVEIRALDVSPFDPMGVSKDELCFLEVLLVYCILRPSPPVSRDERRQIGYNQNKVACCGRDPQLTLVREDEELSLKTWAMEICSGMQAVAELLDADSTVRAYQEALDRCLWQVHDPELAPSARVLNELKTNCEAFFEFGERKSREFAEYFRSMPLGQKERSQFRRMAAESLRQQKEIEAADDISFDEYLRRYYAQTAEVLEEIG